LKPAAIQTVEVGQLTAVSVNGGGGTTAQAVPSVVRVMLPNPTATHAIVLAQLMPGKVAPVPDNGVLQEPPPLLVLTKVPLAPAP
jgi:hypothetical protein